jgi:para-aminobenzoate synthetase component I
VTVATPRVERLSPPHGVMDAYLAVSHLPFPILLDSAERGPRGRYSFAMADPVLTVRSRSVSTEVRGRGDPLWRAAKGDPLSVVRQAMGGFATAPLTGLPPFQGGAAGYIAYEWGRTLERIPAAKLDDLQLPDCVLGVYDWVIAWDHEADAAWIISTGLGDEDAGARLAQVRNLLARSAGAKAIERPASSVPADRPPRYPVAAFRPLTVRSTLSDDQYRTAVERVRAYILAGDAFQVNISQRFDFSVAMTPADAYRRLRRDHPASFGALLELDDFAIASASPERFLRLEDRRVETRPIKGTRQRGADAESDAELEAELMASEKDRAENVMIVDLLRNDLSRVCRPGSIRVTELCVPERHPTVHHLVSTVVGELDDGVDATDLLRAVFPGGSITGAPKIRAMEIIAELEPVCRGVYCGSIGYLSVTGAMDMSIAIRTAVLRGSRAYVSAGGGVTARSSPSEEYDETIAKVRGLVTALASP